MGSDKNGFLTGLICRTNRIVRESERKRRFSEEG